MHQQGLLGAGLEFWWDDTQTGSFPTEPTLSLLILVGDFFLSNDIAYHVIWSLLLTVDHDSEFQIYELKYVS